MPVSMGEFIGKHCFNRVFCNASKTVVELIAIGLMLCDLAVATPAFMVEAIWLNAGFVAYSMCGIHGFVTVVALFGVGKKREILLPPYLIFDVVYVFYVVCYLIPTLHPIPPNTVFVHRWNFHHGSDHVNQLVVENVKRLHERIQTEVAIATFVYLLFALIIWWALLIAYCVIKAEATITSGNTTASTMEGNALTATNNDDSARTVTTYASSGNSHDEEAPQAVVVGGGAVTGGLVTGLRIVDENKPVLAQAAGIFADKAGACPV